MKDFNEYFETNEANIEGDSGWKTSTTGSDELDSKLKELHSEYDIHPAYKDGEIFVGFLKKSEDSTWNNVMTYYLNNNFDISELNIKYNKI